MAKCKQTVSYNNIVVTKDWNKIINLPLYSKVEVFSLAQVTIGPVRVYLKEIQACYLNTNADFCDKHRV